MVTMSLSQRHREVRVADIVDLVYADHDWLRRQFFYLDYATGNADLKAAREVLATRLDTH